MMPDRSHFVYNYEIMKALHADGHHITMITRSHLEYEVENFTYINPPVDDVPDCNTFGFDIRTTTLSHLTKVRITEEAKECRDVMNLKEIKVCIH